MQPNQSLVKERGFAKTIEEQKRERSIENTMLGPTCEEVFYTQAE